LAAHVILVRDWRRGIAFFERIEILRAIPVFRSLLIVLLSLSSASSVIADGPAGIVLYFKTGGEVYLLLADHTGDTDGERGWASYGGAAKKGESPAETAARETEEETRGYFKRDWLLEKIRHQTPFSDGVFSSFYLEVDFVPIPLISNHPLPTKKPDYMERGPYAWIPFSQVAPYLDPKLPLNAKGAISPEYLPLDRKTDWFWSIWLQNLRAARAKNPLPWESAGEAKPKVDAGTAK
jgi:8-oxo-dGTP pyrophosphatase MutT (NUDIX family)